MNRFRLAPLYLLAFALLCCSHVSAQTAPAPPPIPPNFGAGSPQYTQPYPQQNSAAAGPGAQWQNANPCETGPGFLATLPEAAAMASGNFFGPPPQSSKTAGLTPLDFGFIVYDSNQSVCWLADANLAANPLIRDLMGVPNINPDGTMDYPTAVLWVDALNHFAGGRGFLGHHNWQLPDNPLDDGTCSEFNNGGFGASCQASALGNLYYVGLSRCFPDSVVPNFTSTVWPFRNVQPTLYWTSDPGSGSSGEQTFSFNTGLFGSNTIVFNYFHMLPMISQAQGPIGTPPVGSGVLPYTSGLASGKAVYDTNTGITWTLDANLAASQNFGVTGSTVIDRQPNVPPGPALTPLLVNPDGAMLFSTALVTNPLAPSIDGPWLAAMNANAYAGGTNWTMPALADLRTLFIDLGLQPGDRRLESQSFVGPFWHLQPFFYWACEPDDVNATAQAPCDYANFPQVSTGKFQTPLAYSFDFSNGFEGTDLAGPVGPGDNPQSKQFYVMVYFPVTPPSQ